MGESVRHHIKSIIGVTYRRGGEGAGRNSRSMGKAVRVRDLRPNSNWTMEASTAAQPIPADTMLLRRPAVLDVGCYFRYCGYYNTT